MTRDAMGYWEFVRRFFGPITEGRDMIDQMECPRCKGNRWIIWAEPFESKGTLITLTAECAFDIDQECGYKVELGTVEARDMVPRE